MILVFAMRRATGISSHIHGYAASESTAVWQREGVVVGRVVVVVVEVVVVGVVGVVGVVAIPFCSGLTWQLIKAEAVPIRCGCTIGAKIIIHTTFIVGELILQLHTHQLHNFNCRGINLCNACVSLVSVCLASILSQKGNYTTIMVGELISNYTHTSYTTIIVGELVV